MKICDVVKALGKVGEDTFAYRAIMTYDKLMEGEPICLVNDDTKVPAIVGAICLVEYYTDGNDIKEKLIRVRGVRFGQEAVIVVHHRHITESFAKNVKHFEHAEPYIDDLTKKEIEVRNLTNATESE